MFDHQLTKDHRMRFARVLPAAIVAAAALSGTPATAATPTLAPQATGPNATAQGFIMSDGRICDPIRHMGC
jgi:hypothetical protein